jgi:hypothetical protein
LGISTQVFVSVIQWSESRSQRFYRIYDRATNGNRWSDRVSTEAIAQGHADNESAHRSRWLSINLMEVFHAGFT